MNKVYSSLLIAVGFILLLGAVYVFGYKHGRSIGQIALDDYVNRGEQLALENSLKFRQLESIHREKENEILLQLSTLKNEYEATINDLNNDYASRMYESDLRANSYRRQLESGYTGRDTLVRHASKLDKALTEGIILVNELTATIRFMEDQISIRDSIIKNDRNTINEKR